MVAHLDLEKNNMPKIRRKKYYAIHSKSDNFLHGVFPLTEDGLTSAKAYISNLSYIYIIYTLCNPIKCLF